MNIHRAKDVFGIGRELPLNYVVRDNIDGEFVENLTRDKHVVVFGSSKQGKTSLRKYNLEDGDCATISCINNMDLPGLHSAILKQLGFKLETTSKRSTSGALKVAAKFAGKGKVPFLAEASGEGSGEYSKITANEVTSRPLEIELADVNDIVAAIDTIGFGGYIVLEDFHYLPVETQKGFCFALKSFHENSKICFIVIGVWRDKGRLEYYNGDLTGRVISIDADEWKNTQLREVIEEGARLLNVKFQPKFVDDLIESAHDSVYIIQEACLKACQASQVFESQPISVTVGENVNASQLVEQIVESQAGRYNAFITNFSEGFQKTELEMYKWLMAAVLRQDAKSLEKGLRRSDISSAIKAIHPLGASLSEGNITQALQSAAALQVQKGVRPIVMDYDETTRVLHVVDKSFLSGCHTRM